MPRITLRLDDKQYDLLSRLSRQHRSNRCDYLRLLIDQEANQTHLKSATERAPASNFDKADAEKLVSLVNENVILTKFLVLSKNQKVSDEDLKRVIELVKSKNKA